jgi:hypothetical protein
MHRTIGLAGVTLFVALAASPAAAQSRCTAPDEPGWHSCLSASHRTSDQLVLLTKIRPRLVIRYDDTCPKGADRRRVTIRTNDGTRLGRTTVRSRCKRGVARYDTTLRLDVEVDEGTVVRAFWNGIADARTAPRVELTAG